MTYERGKMAVKGSGNVVNSERAFDFGGVAYADKEFTGGNDVPKYDTTYTDFVHVKPGWRLTTGAVPYTSDGSLMTYHFSKGAEVVYKDTDTIPTNNADNGIWMTRLMPTDTFPTAKAAFEVGKATGKEYDLKIEGADSAVEFDTGGAFTIKSSDADNKANVILKSLNKYTNAYITDIVEMDEGNDTFTVDANNLTITGNGGTNNGDVGIDMGDNSKVDINLTGNLNVNTSLEGLQVMHTQNTSSTSVTAKANDINIMYSNQNGYHDGAIQTLAFDLFGDANKHRNEGTTIKMSLEAEKELKLTGYDFGIESFGSANVTLQGKTVQVAGNTAGVFLNDYYAATGDSDYATHYSLKKPVITLTADDTLTVTGGTYGLYGNDRAEVKGEAGTVKVSATDSNESYGVYLEGGSQATFTADTANYSGATGAIAADGVITVADDVLDDTSGAKKASTFISNSNQQTVSGRITANDGAAITFADKSGGSTGTFSSDGVIEAKSDTDDTSVVTAKQAASLGTPGTTSDILQAGKNGTISISKLKSLYGNANASGTNAKVDLTGLYGAEVVGDLKSAMQGVVNAKLYGSVMRGSLTSSGGTTNATYSGGGLLGDISATDGGVVNASFSNAQVIGNIDANGSNSLANVTLDNSTMQGLDANKGAAKLTASDGGSVNLTLNNGSVLVGEADNRGNGSGTGNIVVNLNDGSRWIMTERSYVSELNNPSGAVVDMYQKRGSHDTQTTNLVVGNYKKANGGGLLRMKTNLGGNASAVTQKNVDTMVITNAEQGSEGYVYVYDKSILNNATVTGAKAERLIIDRSGNATFYGQTLNRGGLWDYTPTLEARPTTQEDLDSMEVDTTASSVSSTSSTASAKRRVRRLGAPALATVTTTPAAVATPADLGTTWWLTKYVRELNKDTRPLVYSPDSVYGFYRRSSIDTLRQRLGDIRERGITPGEPNLWVRNRGGRFTYGENDTKYNIFQGGMDFADGDKTMYGFLVERGIATSNYNLGNGKDHMLSGGIYGTWVSDNGSYTDVVAKTGRHHMDVKTGASYPDRARFNEKEQSLSVEYGRTIALDKSGTFIEPQVQFVHGRLGKINYTSQRGTQVHVDGFNSDIGRLGLVIGKKRQDVAHPFSFYAKVSLLREFGDDRRVSLMAANGETMEGKFNYKDTWYEVGLGATCQLSAKSSFYIDMERSFSDDFTKKWQVNGGFSWKF